MGGLQVGLYARVFPRATVEETLDAVVAAGVAAVQFGLDCAGLEAVPAAIPAEMPGRIHAAHEARGVRLAAVSGTVNMIHPDPEARSESLRRLEALIRSCPAMGAPAVTLCTGTRDPTSMWRHHPANASPEAWRDLLAALSAVLPAAEAAGVDLAMEPEVANVVDSAARARRLMDELASPRLRVCIDGANLFHRGELARQAEVLDAAFDLVGPDVVLAHAKDLDHDGEAGHLPAGRGRLDYGRYVRLLRRVGYRGAVVLHGLAEADVPACAAFLRGHLGSAG